MIDKDENVLAATVVFGCVYFNAGKYEKAIEEFERVLKQVGRAYRTYPKGHRHACNSDLAAKFKNLTLKPALCRKDFIFRAVSIMDCKHRSKDIS